MPRSEPTIGDYETKYHIRTWAVIDFLRKLFPPDWPIGTDVKVCEVLYREFLAVIRAEREACARTAGAAGTARWPMVIHDPVATVVAAILARGSDAPK